jgi:hypothetical protein
MFYPGFRILIFHPGSRIQGQKHSGSRIRIRTKQFKYFSSQKFFLRSRKHDPGYSSRIRILIFYPSWILDPGGKKKHRIPDPERQRWLKDYFLKKKKVMVRHQTYTGRPAASHQSAERTGVPFLLLLLPGLHGAGETTTAGHYQPHQVPSVQPPAQAPLPPHCG